MIFTDNPVYDAERYSEEQEAALEKLPVCCECDKHIQDEYAYYINDMWICDDCMTRNYRREVSDL